MSELIEIRDMCKIYNPGENEVRALDHVSLTIEQNEFGAIIGQSGSGKSTLMNMLGCLDVPTTGTYILNGQDVSNLSDDELSDIRNKEIGFIFQKYQLISQYTVLQNVIMPLLIRGIPRKEAVKLAEEKLEMLGMADRLNHKPNELSGGQQQRVSIARALVGQPSILLADEPTGALDSKTGEEVLNLFQELNDMGNSIIMITHDPKVSQKAKRIVKIIDGRLYLE